MLTSKSRHALLLAMLAALAMTGCTPPPAAPPPANAVPPAMVSYGNAIIAKMDTDPTLIQILTDYHVTQTLPVALVIEPNGYVDNSIMRAAPGQPAGLQQAVGNYLINVNFGAFPPGISNHKLTFVMPLHPPPGVTGPTGMLDPSIYSMTQITLYQPNNMLAPRVNVHLLANYIGRLNASLGAVFAAAPPQPGVTAAVVIGVKPSCSSRAWVVPRTGTLSPALAAQLITVAQAVPATPVVDGPIAFAINFNAWGGGPPPLFSKTYVPFPKEWRFSGTQPVLVPDGIFAKIWP